ncbi:MAG: membrane dipeptidase [Gammaproteobacteria bacterium]|jgi:membrane dipeptidase|nr:membrane dipeptidase [Gammaproteobacteria bacterium]
MTNRLTCLLATATLLAACGADNKTGNEPAVVDYAAEAQRIAQSSIIIDTHIDVPMKLAMTAPDVSRATDSGDFDYPRAVAGGLNVPFMSIYTPASYEAEGKSKAAAELLIDLVEKMVANAPDKFSIATSVADVRSQFDAGLMSIPMGMENGSPIDGDLANLKHFYDRGIRYVTPAHSLSNHISDSSYDENRQWNGLSEFGKEAIREMNRLGMMIDVSHVSDDAFWQIIEISEAPVIASHSSARYFTPGFERNMNDEMIVAMAEKGGVIQINFGSTFVNQESRDYGDARSAAGKQYLLEHPDLTEAYLYQDYPAVYAEEHGPLPFATVDDVLDHFDHVVKLTGVDHVGIGSDYDGVGDSLPTGLKDVSSYPNLIAGLLERGYSEEDIRKILGENLLRVWDAVESYAATTSSST